MTPPEQIVDPNVRILASPGRRLGARALDSLFLLLFGAVVIGIGLAVSGGEGTGLIVAVAMFFVLAVVVYEPVMVAVFGGTLGKQVLGLRVVPLREVTRPPNFGISLWRWFFPVIFQIVPFGSLLNVLWCTWDRPLVQCLHDKVAGTVVLRAAAPAFKPDPARVPAPGPVGP